jgi:hypothetical protein
MIVEGRAILRGQILHGRGVVKREKVGWANAHHLHSEREKIDRD